MRDLDRRQLTAVMELIESGAIDVMGERMLARVITESMENTTMRDDRETRAKLGAIHEFGREAQAVYNSMRSER